MTSQLNVDTIVDKAGSGGTNVKVANTSTYVSDAGSVTQNTVQSLIKAWIKFSGSAASIHGSFNISSLTDNGTGDYSPNFTNNMNTSNDFAATTAGQDSNTRDNVHFSFEGQSASDINIEYYEGASKADCVRVASIISGDLA
jgi:hypothetical protein